MSVEVRTPGSERDLGSLPVDFPEIDLVSLSVIEILSEFMSEWVHLRQDLPVVTDWTGACSVKIVRPDLAVPLFRPKENP